LHLACLLDMKSRTPLFIAASLAVSLYAQVQAKQLSTGSIRGGNGGQSNFDRRDLQISGFVTGLDLINADTDVKVTTLTSNQVVVLSDIPGMATPSFNIEATFTGSGIDSVLFKYGGSNYRTDKGAPYSFCGNSGRAFDSCSKLGIGTHTVSATPYSSVATGSVAGTEVTVTFTIVAGASAPIKPPVSSPAMPPVATPIKAPVSAPVTPPVAAPIALPTPPPVPSPMAAPVFQPPVTTQCAVPKVCPRAHTFCELETHC
jgi:hypothetical protein